MFNIKFGDEGSAVQLLLHKRQVPYRHYSYLKNQAR